MTRFRPGFAPTLVVLAVLPLLVFLGFWQLDRGEQKRELLNHYAERQVAAPVTVGQLLTFDDPAFRRRADLDQSTAGRAFHLDRIKRRLRLFEFSLHILRHFQDVID